MRPKDQRRLLVTVLLTLLPCAAFALLLAGVEVTALKELLTILFPPLVALTAAGVGREGRRRSPPASNFDFEGRSQKNKKRRHVAARGALSPRDVSRCPR